VAELRLARPELAKHFRHRSHLDSPPGSLLGSVENPLSESFFKSVAVIPEPLSTVSGIQPRLRHVK
jgi:hypothetical protein